MLKNYLAGLASFALIFPQVVVAQEADGGRPDEGTSWKYFYFHRLGNSEAEARADIVECYSYAENLTVMEAGSNPTYMSVPYGGTTGLSAGQAALAGGIGSIAGAIIVGFMNAGQRRAMARTNLRKCFGFKGYDRYELTKDEYQAVQDGDGEEVRARLVEKAVGPAPEAERLVR